MISQAELDQIAARIAAARVAVADSMREPNPEHGPAGWIGRVVNRGDNDCPLIVRITHVEKTVTPGLIRLYGRDEHGRDVVAGSSWTVVPL